MTKEYIEREAAKERLRMWITDCVLDGDNDAADCFRGCIDLIDSIPATDVSTVRHGRWVNTRSDSEFVQCSLCKYPVYAAWNVTSYCPNCGAYMMGENNGKCE